jgi:N6-L-threonylcarbamoyladenine synthase
LPLIPINHVEAHVYACIMELEAPLFPLAALVVSGGHTSLYRVSSPLELELIGRTLDDAAGEAFDKVAAILGLGYPGGPAVEAAARTAGPERPELPRPLPGDRDCLDFSFSGLKTAVLYRCRGIPREEGGKPSRRKGRPGPEITIDPGDEKALASMAAAFQEAVVDVLTARLFQAAGAIGARAVAAGGGVAANALLRERIRTEAGSRGLPVYLSPRDLATDNAAMGAGLAFHILRSGRLSDGRRSDRLPGLGIDAFAC